MNLQTIKVDHLPPEGQPLPNRTWPFLWHFIRQAKAQLLWLTIIYTAGNALDAVQYYFVKLFVDAFGKTHDLPTLLHLLKGTIITYLVLMTVTQPVLARYGQWLMSNIRPAFMNLIRRQLARHMHGHSYGYFQNDFAGRLASKVIETPTAIGSIISTFTGSLGRAFVILTTALVLFSKTYWLFSALVVIWALSYAVLLRIYVPRILRSSKQSYDQQSVIRGRFVDTLTNIMTVKLFARAKHEDAYLVEALQEQTSRGQKMMHTINGMNIWLEVISSAFLACAFGSTVYAWSRHAITAGDAAMILPMTVQLMNISWWMSDVITGLFESIGQVQEGMQAITIQQNVEDRPGAAGLHVARGDITFRHVDFSYNVGVGANNVLSDFNLEIPAGQKVGLIGPSGAGKSTLVQLLLRLHDIQKGEIAIDGQDIAAVTQDSLRAQIGVIPQTADLLHRSVRDNIRYGRLDATEEEIVDAARRAHAEEFILGLADQQGRKGYETLVGERGVKLSGGQRQRVAIARAIVKNAPILILDEATSALDSESERLIQAALHDLMQGKTVVAIAHRLSTIAGLDRLIVIDRGRIVEDGPHAELLTKGGLYQRLWGLQSGGFLAKAA